MENKIIIFLFVFWVNLVYSQSRCINYNIFSKNKSDLKTYSKLITNLDLKLNNSNVKLLIDKNNSLFELKPKINSSIEDIETILDMAEMISNKCYTFIDSNYSYYEKSNYLIRNVKKTNWKITDETKIIEGFKCYKATCILEKIDQNKFYYTYPIVAWFTYDINNPFGPNGIGGLPGLILELEQAIFIFKATKINLNSIEKVAFPYEKKVIEEYEMFKYFRLE